MHRARVERQIVRFALLPLLLMTLAAARAQAPVEYVVRLKQPQTQMVDLSVRLTDVQSESVEFKLPTWRPGKYVILDPAGTVRDAQAFDGDGGPLPTRKVDKSTWRVDSTGAGTVELRYRIYANSLRDRTRHVDDTHAFLSGESVFMYNPDRRNQPVSVRIEAPADWNVATGLERAPRAASTFVAPDYDTLIDSPFEIGLHDTISFDVDGVPHEIVIWGDADYDEEELKGDFAAIVREQVAIFGGMPYRRYVFMIHVGKGAGGGTEHLNSTIMQTDRASLEDPDRYERFLGLVSHEFFHTWNVKQFRPAGIHPYDYERENYTDLLWVAEGTTSYYDDLTLARAGLVEVDDYLDGLANAIENLQERPGRLAQSLAESSFDAWIKFNRSTPDDFNSTISFYSKGALVSLLLDMELRRASDGAMTLDHLMRALYKRYPLSGPGYTADELESLAERLSGATLETFFERYVYGVNELEFAEALAPVGVEVRFEPATDDDDEEDEDDVEPDGDASAVDDPAADEKETPQRPYLGLRLSGRRVSTVIVDGPVYDAGIIADDEILAIDGRRFDGGLDDRLESYDVGDTITLTYFRHDELREITIELSGVPDGEWRVERVEDPTDAQRAAYESWIGHPWPDDDEDGEETDAESEPDESH